MIKTKSTKHGFTLIELSLAMIFLAILLLTIALITTQIIAIYQKGLAIKAVSSTGRELVDDITRAIAASPTKSKMSLCSKITGTNGRLACENDESPRTDTEPRGDEGFKFIYQQQTGNVKIGGSSQDTSVPTHGVFCTGRYSYLWNTGYTLNDKLYPTGSSYRAKLRYRIDAATNPAIGEVVSTDGVYKTVEVKDYRLLKMRDQERIACTANIDLANYRVNNNNQYDITASPISNEPEELLTPSEDNLAIYDFKIFPPIQHTFSLHTFYSGTFILATLPGGVDITGTGDYCTETPDGLDTDFAYCAINKFNFAMRATGETNDEEKKQQKQN